MSFVSVTFFLFLPIVFALHWARPNRPWQNGIILIGALFGITLRRNFRYSYFSRSLSEFWQRWHITLSSWMRDYVFNPLGGSRGTLSLTVRNIFITLLVSGLWHGAAWHFVVWGGLHAVGLALTHSWRAIKVRS